MKELIDRLAKLEGPDRTLDLAISVAINFKGEFDPEREWKWSVMADEIRGYGTKPKGGVSIACLDPAQFVPRWTRSIDAALKLIPDGLFWSISHGRTKSGEPLGGVAIRTPLLDVVSEAEAETTELAICIAALKARAAQL